MTSRSCLLSTNDKGRRPLWTEASYHDTNTQESGESHAHRCINPLLSVCDSGESTGMYLSDPLGTPLTSRSEAMFSNHSLAGMSGYQAE
mmetsp:Transcript_5374/g.20063  ORF Transcript_5374/g.20063 Transcript_5374/m.20063 type:complete len:89 (-) Transcript_5374:228-494(-)